MRHALLPLLIAVQFLTTLPIHLPSMPSAKQNAASVLYYPVVGLGVGALLLGCATLLLYLPVLVTAFCVVLVWVLATGGLHLDGLADSADAWVGGFGDTQRTLAIMKDPACGAMGVLALVFAVLCKVVLLTYLLEIGAFWVLLYAPIIGRLSVVGIFLAMPYVRSNGLGSQMALLSRKWAWWVLMLCSSGLVLWQGLMIPMCVLVLLVGFCAAWRRRIGGVTGDVLGAAVELSEMAVLMAAVFSLSTPS